MPSAPGRDASLAIADFSRQLNHSGLSATTVRIRQHYLSEYLLHAQQAAGEEDIDISELLSPEQVNAWLDDAAAGKTRTRNTMSGPEANAHPNSMRARIDTFNAFAEFLGVPDRLDTQQPEPGDSLSPDEAKKLLHVLSIRRPVNANATTALRTAAVAALVAATGRTVPELAGLNVRDVHLDADPHVDLGIDPYPLSPEAAHVLTRWLEARTVITAELEGSDPGYLWIPTKPGRPRGGKPPVKPGLSRAAVRTLHASHRTLVSQLFGGPMRPGTLRILHEDEIEEGQPAQGQAS
jgi:site-specific recombinase XerD